ncbi:MAG: hypothetical protein JW754_00225 [Candidatus Aenigmarchaeota archaeon]|nr:hypothetical protein [Candidatus Aenigmarchaeota archaeon]
MHFLPFKGNIQDIIKRNEIVNKIDSINKLKKLFKKNGKYLFLQINNDLFSADTKIGKPRFFRDRFAEYFGEKERGNWKEMDKNERIMKEASKEVRLLKEKWFHRNPIE